VILDSFKPTDTVATEVPGPYNSNRKIPLLTIFPSRHTQSIVTTLLVVVVASHCCSRDTCGGNAATWQQEDGQMEQTNRSKVDKGLASQRSSIIDIKLMKE
jgi:hypothetical protein